LLLFSFFCCFYREEGEEVNELPYVRISKRHDSSKKNRAPRGSLQNAVICEVNPDRLTATKRIINAYNSGDIEAIKDIIYECTVGLCEIYFSSLTHVFIGKAALFSLWVSLFEAFPNGIFRTSDSVINENKQVYTKFLFNGTKIFPLLIDGVPVELLQSHGLLSSAEDPSIVVQSASVIADRTRPMFNTAELLETDDIPEMIFEGRIILQMNELCQIKRFDFSWSRKL
jgi:predicted ester cyclase